MHARDDLRRLSLNLRSCDFFHAVDFGSVKRTSRLISMNDLRAASFARHGVFAWVDHVSHDGVETDDANFW